jgi:Zn-dependent protease
MKNRGTKIGEPFGIGVYIHWTFWVLLAYFSLPTLARDGLLAALSEAGLVFGVFGCVVLHELGHSLAARTYGIQTADITLYPIGGVARLERMPRAPTHEMVIAIAGPLVNVAIALGLWVLMLLGWSDRFMMNLLYVNLMLVCFNLVPAFPMDGGRVFRAFLSLFQSRQRATNIAATTGKVFAGLMVLYGLFGNPVLIFIGIFIWMAGEAERRSVAAEVTWQAPAGGPPPLPHEVIEPEIVWPDDPGSFRG